MEDNAMTVLKDIYDATVKGNYADIQNLIEKALGDKTPIHTIINDALYKALLDVGDKFGAGEFFFPDILLAAKTTKHAMKILKPLIKGEGSTEAVGAIVHGTVKGDLHDIGKNLVITMAEGQGFDVIDLGVDVDYQTFVDAIREYNPKIVAFSGLLTTTLANVPDHIRAIKEAGFRDKVKLAVGGAPVTRDFAVRNNIEIYADDAAAAAKEFLKAVKDQTREEK
jgi:5-methyltetrahydrofolate--homocysteine methyltransferase